MYLQGYRYMYLTNVDDDDTHTAHTQLPRWHERKFSHSNLSSTPRQLILATPGPISPVTPQPTRIVVGTSSSCTLQVGRTRLNWYL